MNRTIRVSAIPALTIALLAGTTATVWAQDTSRPPQQDSQRGTGKDQDRATKKDMNRQGDRAQNTMPTEVDFRSASWMKGRDVANSSGDQVGDVEDLVLDRGSGRVQYVVIKTGSFMNMGGKSVAVPFSSLRWNQGKDEFVLETTKEQLKAYPAFTTERWSELDARGNDRDMNRDANKNDRDPGKTDRDSNRPDRDQQNQNQNPNQNQNQTDRDRQTSRDMSRDGRHILPDSPSAANLYAGHYDVNRKVHIEGEVTDVDRMGGRSGDEIVVTVKANDGSTRRVSLGPSWYVGGASAAPMRGDRVVIDSYEIRDEPGLSTASRARIGDREVEFRDQSGNPRWTSNLNAGKEAGAKSYSSHYMRYVLASDVKGMKVECRGTECGKVNDVIIDRSSGEVAMLSIDPNQNFLGIGDTKRLVPWSVANVSLAGTVHLDATKEMILASPETPSDLSTLNTSDRTKMVFDAYHVRMPDFDSRRNMAMGENDEDIWGMQGPVVTGIERGSDKTITGKLVSVSEMKLGEGRVPAKVLKVRTTNGQEETIVLGPAWYVEKQGASWTPGSDITLEVNKSRVGDRTYWITRSWERDGKRVAVFENDRPMWGDR